jgi:hypothetical protein
MKFSKYYYQFPFTFSISGNPGGGCYVQHGIIPVYYKGKAVDISEYAKEHAFQVWEEYEDGTVKMIKNHNALSPDKPRPLDYNEQEFLLVKLRARDINE